MSRSRADTHRQYLCMAMVAPEERGPLCIIT
jgi:hypothetical protein